MPRRIVLVPSVTPDYPAGGALGFRLRVEATEASGMEPAIFRYLQHPPAPGSDAPRGTFDGVCSPSDLEELPTARPEADAAPPWFRLSFVDLVFRSSTELEEALGILADEARALVAALDRLDVLEALPPIEIESPA